MVPRPTFAWLCTIFAVLLVNTSWAVINATTTGNTTQASVLDDPGWDNVGNLTGFSNSVVYLGNRWVISANHNGIGSVDFSGTTYAQDGSGIRLSNPAGSGLSGFADLLMWQIVSAPPLPSLTISGATTPIGDEVTMIGNGKNRGATQKAWDVAMVGDDWVWTETTPPGDIRGWDVLGSNSKRWGTNVVEDDNEPDAGHNIDIENTLSTIVLFDENVANEAQAQLHDSGGGVFYKNGGSWELSGIMISLGILHDQPDDPIGTPFFIDTVVFGNATYAADLSVYKDQIVSIIPEPSAACLTLLGLIGLLLRGARRVRGPASRHARCV